MTQLSPARTRRIVAAMRRRRIGVVGDVMLDRYVWGTATRLSPEAAVPVVDFVEETSRLGGAANVAANLAALGARVAAFGVVGADDFAPQFRACMKWHKLPVSGLVEDAGRKTTVKTRIVARHQQVVRVDRESREPIAAGTEEQLIRRIVPALRGLHALVVSDYDKGVITEDVAERVLGACQRVGVPTFVKPKWSRLPKYPGATAIVLNRGEAGFLVTRTLDDDASVEDAGRALLAHFGCPAVIITRGEKGMSVFEQDAPRGLHIHATSRDAGFGSADARLQGRQVFDVTGAGDTVLATLTLAVAAGAKFGEAAVLANHAAGVVVGKVGTATASPAELLASLRGR